MIPGERAYNGYLDKAGGRSLINGDKLPKFSDLNEEVQDAWAAAEAAAGDPVHAATTLNGVTASQCALGVQGGAHTALRFVWHHILPQVCGGKSTTANLIELCDNCHYAVHAILYILRMGGEVPGSADEGQVEVAEKGYQLAVKAGTENKIPKESAATG